MAAEAALHFVAHPPASRRTVGASVAPFQLPRKTEGSWLMGRPLLVGSGTSMGDSEGSSRLRMMATMAPMQKPVDRMVMTASRRPLTPELQPPHTHRWLVALQTGANAGGRCRGGECSAMTDYEIQY